MINEEIRKFEELTGKIANDFSCAYVGGYLDGYDKGKAEAADLNPKGEWIKIDEEWYDYKCSVCGEKVKRLYPFCHCGADMRKGGAK